MNVSFFILGPCDPGYYCTGGAYITNPINNSTGDICPQHYICPGGSDLPRSCPIGYYANQTGMYQCELCLAGYLCYPKQAPTICPMGQYCIMYTLYHINSY